MANISDIKNSIVDPKQKQLTPVARLKDLLGRVDIKEKFNNMLKDKAPAFVSSLISLHSANQQLQEADPMSIISAAAIAATLDLPINPQLGFAHIVPYGREATFQIGWKGFVQLAIRTGQYKTMNAAEIYEGELIRYDRITGETTIDEAKRKSNKITGYVAYFRLSTGFEKFLYMTMEQVQAHAKRFSKSYGRSGSAWTTNFDAMALKTVLKLLLSKYGILSVEMQKALEFDQAAVRETSDGIKPDYIDADTVNDAQDPVDAPQATPKIDGELPLNANVKL